MATATTGTTVIDQLGDEIPGLLWKFTGTATSGGATVTTTNPEINKLGSNAATDRFSSLFLYIPTGTAGTDDVHSVTTISVSAATATITTLGNYGATYTNAAMYLIGIHPDIFRRLLNDALEKIHVECIEWLVHGPSSANMQGSSVDADWTESGASDTVQTTASEVAFGQQSLVVTDSGSAGGYTQSALAALGQGRRVRLHGVVKADTGTSILRALDGSGNVQDSISTTQEDWVYLSKTVGFDSADEQIRLRLVASAASDSGDWNLAGYVKEGIYRFLLPSYMDERFKVKAVCRAIFHETGSEADTWLYDSMELETLVEERDYRYVTRQTDANPHAIVFEPHIDLMSYAYCVLIDAPYSAPYGVASTLSADTGTSYCPLHLWVPYCKHLIGLRYGQTFPELAPRNPDNPYSTPGYKEYQAHGIARTTEKPKPQVVVRRVFG